MNANYTTSRKSNSGGSCRISQWAIGQLLTAALVFGLFVSSAPAQSTANSPGSAGLESALRMKKSSEALQALKARMGEDVVCTFRPEAGTPREIKAPAGRFLQPAVRGADWAGDEAVATAKTFLNTNKDLLGAEAPEAEFTLERRNVCELGRAHLRFTQTHAGLPVWPATLIVHLDQDGNVDLFNGMFVPTPKDTLTTPQIEASAAVVIAQTRIPGSSGIQVDQPVLIIHAADDGQTRLGWKLNLNVSPEACWTVVVDAENGEVLRSFNQVPTGNVPGSGRDLQGATRQFSVWQEGSRYFMADTSKPMFDSATGSGYIGVADLAHTQDIEGARLLASEQAAQWTPPDAVSLFWGLGRVYDYYQERHGRNSIDGNGCDMIGMVRYDVNHANAFWSPTYKLVVFGDGAPFAAAIEIIGHEITHGVTGYTSDLIYQDQPGALNEAMSDIFGEMVEAYTYGQPDWLKGAALGEIFQDYANPHNAQQAGFTNPARMSEYVDNDWVRENDQGGVHINCSIINHCFWKLAVGINGGIGLEDAAEIFYRANTQYLVPNSQFLDCRLACVRSAEELFGAGSTQALRTAAAFDAVEIFAGGTGGNSDSGDNDGDRHPAGDDRLEENDGDTQAAEIAAGTYQLQGLDHDWFLIRISEPGTLLVEISGPSGDLDLGVSDAAGNVIGISNALGSNERVEGSVVAGDVYVLVAPYDGQTSAYTLRVSTTGIAPPPPCLCGVCTPLPMLGLLIGRMGLDRINRRRAL